jgi:caffeoyl-CoA O-methyltransferase
MNDELLRYAEERTSDEGPVLQELRAHCYANHDDHQMLSGFLQGRVLSMLSHMIKPNVVVEIGTYLGYSALCLAEGLAEGGKVITIDIQEDTNKIARSFVARTEYAGSIEFVLSSATDFIPTMTETIDLAFIDADKVNYSNYYDLVFDRLNPGGFIIADNVLWGGKVLDEEKDESTQALYDFGIKVQDDDRVENVLLPIRDGLMIVKKKASRRRGSTDDEIPIYELSL